MCEGEEELVDTRVMGLLQKYFGLNLNAEAVQSSEALYRTLEKALNDVCRELGVELSWLDRVLFQRNDDISHMFDEMGVKKRR
jgi:thermostable 8-oxoguanine DNA glycosylase